jgi:hypothetical protein
MIKRTNSNQSVYWIVGFFTFFITGFIGILSLHEWYSIAILNLTSEYPFGGESPTQYYYRTAKLYALVNLAWGILFIGILIFSVVVMAKKRERIFFAFALTLLLLIAMFIHGQIGL